MDTQREVPAFSLLFILVARPGFDIDHFWRDATYNRARLLEPGGYRNGSISIKLGPFFGSGTKK